MEKKSGKKRSKKKAKKNVDIIREQKKNKIITSTNLFIAIVTFVILILTFSLNGPKIKIYPSEIKLDKDFPEIKFNVDKPYLVFSTFKGVGNYISLGIALNNIGNMTARNVKAKWKLLRIHTKSCDDIPIPKDIQIESYTGPSDLTPDSKMSSAYKITIDLKQNVKEQIINDINNGRGYVSVEIKVTYSHPWFSIIKYKTQTTMTYYSHKVKINSLMN